MSVAAAALATAIVLALGALASAAVLPPTTLSAPTRIASIPAAGCTVASLAGALLAVAHLLNAVAMLIVLAGTAAGLAVLAKRNGTLAWLRRCTRRPGMRTETLPVWLGAAVLVAIAVARLGIPVSAAAGGWRYWADGLELASAGHVPAATLQWGALYPPAVSKLAANAFAAELSFGFAHHPLAGMAVLLWLSAVGYVAGLWALGWELGLRWAAPLLPVLALAGEHSLLGLTPGSEIAVKLEAFQDEDMGRALAAFGAALAVRTIRGAPGRAGPAAAVAVLTAAALTHLIPVMVVAALLIPYAAATAIAGRGVRPAAAGVVLVIAPVAVALGLLAAAGGDVGLAGSAGSAAYVDVQGRYDPTLAFDGRRQAPVPKSERRWYTPPARVAHDFLGVALGDWAAGWRLSVVAAALAAALAGVALLGGADLRLAAVSAACMAALLLAAGLWFSFSSAYYIPATFGERRLFEYGALPLMLLLLALVEAAVLTLGRADGRAPAVAAAVLVLGGLTGTAALSPNLRTLSPLGDYITAARIATPCDSRLLPDISTRGAFQSLTGRASLLEGLAPYLRPGILARVLSHTAAARRFLHDPLHNVTFLQGDHVDDVLVHRGAGGRRWAAFDAVPQLTMVRQVGGVRVYRYDGPGAGGGPRPANAPGYPCQTRVLA